VSRREYPLPFAAGNLTLAFQSIAYFKIYKTEVEYSGNYFVRGYPGIILCRPKKNNVIIIFTLIHCTKYLGAGIAQRYSAVLRTG
jgi:hypothetical protein